MEDIIFMNKFIDIDQPMSKNPDRFSTLGILLRGARHLSGRDLYNGIYKMKELTKQNFKRQTYFPNFFTGLINYLIFLEQLGGIFKIKGRAVPNQKNGIHLAFKNFFTLTDDKIFAIRALRNSLVHQYGLATGKENGKNIKLIYKFTVSVERNSEIVKLPLTTWDGSFSNKNDESNTTIYVIDLIDVIEKLYSKLKEEINNNNVEFNVSLDELKARFTIII